jgi:hypothetical protein
MASRAPKNYLSDEEKAALRADRRDGMTFRELGLKYHIGPTTAGRIAYGVKVEAPRESKQGTRVSPATREQVRADRRLGFTFKALAGKYGIHPTTAHAIAYDVEVEPEFQAAPIKKAGPVVATRKGDSIALARRCEEVGWETDRSATNGIKVYLPDGTTNTIHLSYSDRRSLLNVTADLERRGLKEAEETMAREEAEKRLKRIAQDRTSNEIRLSELQASQEQQQRAMLLRAAGPYLGEPENVELAWFTQPHPAPWMRWVWMTAPIAKYLLDHHNKPGKAGEPGTNRAQSDGQVNHYRDVIISGQWHLTHQGMASDVDGMVQDGQHRMEALVVAAELDPELRIPVAYFVGMPRENFKMIDEGLMRTASQLFAMGGEKNGGSLKSALRLIIAHQSGDASVRAKLRLRNTNAALLEAFAKNPEMLRAGAKLASSYASKVPMSAGAYTALHFLLYSANGEDNRFVDAFFHGIVKGTMINNPRMKLEDDDPRAALRRTLQTFKEKEGRSMLIMDQLGLGLYGWNNMVQGIHRRTLTWRKDSDIPQVLICKDTPGAVPPRALIGEVDTNATETADE